MNATYRNFLIGLVLAVLLGAGFYFFILPNIGSTGNIQVTKQPSLDRPFNITVEMPEDAKAVLKKNVVEITKNLRTDPNDYEEWLQLAIHYKIAGDFEGAKNVWEYVAENGGVRRYVALGNLGSLYLYQLKDYPKSESYYNQALALKPDEISFYRDLYTLYHYAYKMGTGADAAILEQGLKVSPGNEDLLALQEELKSGK